MKETLTQLFEHKPLTEEHAYRVLLKMGKGEYNNSQIAAFLAVFLMRPISIDELSGFRNALLDLCIRVDLSDFDAIDVCGTGGDGKDTFNISTLSAFVVAGAGYKVAKHGNYSVSSSCGSSNVMEHFGYRFTNDASILQKQLDRAGICIMHAPLFHPAMKNVVPVRRELGMKTFFNMLGPLVNPGFPKKQVVGVFNLELARIYNYLLQESGIQYNVIFSLDGYDEVSLTGPFKVFSNQNEQLVFPEQLGFMRGSSEAIYGGSSVAESGRIFSHILEGQGTEAQNNVVIANAAYAIKVLEEQLPIADCIEKASDSLKSGNALKSLKILLQNS